MVRPDFTTTRPGEALHLRLLLQLICSWELAGLNNVQINGRRIPTISRCVDRLPVWQRAAIIVVAGAVLCDHWITKRWF